MKRAPFDSFAPPTTSLMGCDPILEGCCIHAMRCTERSRGTKDAYPGGMCVPWVTQFPAGHPSAHRPTSEPARGDMCDHRLVGTTVGSGAKRIPPGVSLS
jgi:hypothetical protein